MKRVTAFLFLAVLWCASAVHAQTPINLPVAVSAVTDLGNGPMKYRVVQGNGFLFSSQSSGLGSTSGSSTTLTLTATPTTPPCVGCAISGTGINPGTTVAAYSGVTVTLSAAMTVASNTPISWGAACPGSVGSAPYLQTSVMSGYYLLYTEARVCVASPGGNANAVVTLPLSFDVVGSVVSGVQGNAPLSVATVNNIATVSFAFDSNFALNGSSLGLHTGTANLFMATPNGSSGEPTLRAIVGADLPFPGPSSLGGAQSQSCGTSPHSVFNSLSTSGVLNCIQLGTGDISGYVAPPSLPLSVANGGTGTGTAGGTALDNITGFSSTGFMSRTGAGAYSFTGSTGSGNVVLANRPAFNLGGGTATGEPFTMMYSVVNAIGTGADTTEDTLQMFSVPANTFGGSHAGQGMRITAWGTFGADTNNKTVRLYFGSSVIYTSGTLTQNGTVWHIEGWVFDQGNSTNQYAPAYGIFGSVVVPTTTIPQLSQTETSAIVVKVTGQNGTATAGDIVCFMLQIEWFNYN